MENFNPFSSLDFKGSLDSPYNPQHPKICFGNQDIRILSDRSFFEEFDALRKSYQKDKDFINDQDSVTGIDLIPNMIKNILCTKIGSFSGDSRFGVNLTPYLFEQLDWVSTVALRDEINHRLGQNLPGSVNVESVEILSNPGKMANTVEISVEYSIGNGDHYTEEPEFANGNPGKNLNTKKVQFTLGVDGFGGFGKYPRKVIPYDREGTNFRRAQ